MRASWRPSVSSHRKINQSGFQWMAVRAQARRIQVPPARDEGRPRPSEGLKPSSRYAGTARPTWSQSAGPHTSCRKPSGVRACSRSKTWAWRRSMSSNSRTSPRHGGGRLSRHVHPQVRCDATRIDWKLSAAVSPLDCRPIDWRRRARRVSISARQTVGAREQPVVVGSGVPLRGASLRRQHSGAFSPSQPTSPLAR